MAFSPTTVTLQRWHRVALVAGAAVLALAVGLYTYRYVTRTITLTVAAGSADGEAVALMSAIAARMASTKSPIRLKVVNEGTALDASKAFAANRTDLAVIRGDIGTLPEARTVVLLTRGVVLIVVPPGSTIDSIAKLKGMTVGVVGLELNRGIVAALTKEYDFGDAGVRFVNLGLNEVRNALQSKQVQALLVVTPISEKYLSMLRGFFTPQPAMAPSAIAIDAAGAIAAVTKPYESYDLPKGTIRGSPAIPSDDLTTLRVPYYLVANAALNADQVTALTKAIMDARIDLIAAHPLLAQIAAPDTDKDAFIPVHPGAAVYYSGDEQSFFDKYGDQLFYGSMLLGTLMSILAAAWKFMGFGVGPVGPFSEFDVLTNRVRAAREESELGEIEDEIDGILKVELARHASGDAGAIDPTALGLAAHRLEALLDRRRRLLGTNAAEQPQAPAA